MTDSSGIDTDVQRCYDRIKQGFESERFILMGLMKDRRDEVLARLQSLCPEYAISTFQASGIWVEGDEQAYICWAIAQVRRASRLLDDVKQSYVPQVTAALRTAFPPWTFDIMTRREDGNKVIVVNGLRECELYAKKDELFY